MLALAVLVSLPLWEAWRLSACFLRSLFPSRHCWEMSSGLAGRWELAFFFPSWIKAQQRFLSGSLTLAEHGCPSLLQKRHLSSAGKPAPELLQPIKAFAGFKRGNRTGNGDVLALTLASPVALSKSPCLCVPQFHAVQGLQQHHREARTQILLSKGTCDG